MSQVGYVTEHDGLLHDNAAPHEARATIQYLKGEKQRRGTLKIPEHAIAVSRFVLHLASPAELLDFP